MTQDEIIDMARQAGLIVNSPYLMPHDHVMRGIEAFAKLVEERTAAKEREEIAKLVEPDTEHRNNSHEYLGAEEGILLLDEIAEAIRTRGEVT